MAGVFSATSRPVLCLNRSLITALGREQCDDFATGIKLDYLFIVPLSLEAVISVKNGRSHAPPMIRALIYTTRIFNALLMISLVLQILG
jgi:hypothetical protein